MKVWWWRVRYAFWFWRFTGINPARCWSEFAVWVETEFMEDQPRALAYNDISSLAD